MGGLVKAYVFSYLCCFYCIFTLDWVDGLRRTTMYVLIACEESQRSCIAEAMATQWGDYIKETNHEDEGF